MILRRKSENEAHRMREETMVLWLLGMGPPRVSFGAWTGARTARPVQRWLSCGFSRISRGTGRRDQSVSVTFLKLHVMLHQLTRIVIALR